MNGEIEIQIIGNLTNAGCLIPEKFMTDVGVKVKLKSIGENLIEEKRLTEENQSDDKQYKKGGELI